MLAPLWANPEDARPRKRQRRGGWRQHLAEGSDEEQPAWHMSKLAAGLLLEWCDGITSGTRVCLHASNAEADGVHHPMVSRLAKIGPRSSPQNCNAGLVSLLGECGIPGLLTTLDGAVTHMILPSTYLRTIARTYPNEFRIRFGTARNKIKAFWEGFLSRPQNRQWARQHPDLRGKTPAQLARAVPCSVHEDAGPCSKTLSVNNVSFASLLATGDEKITKFLCCTYVTKEKGGESAFPAWRRILQDFDELSTGEVSGSHVALDQDGNPLQFISMFAKLDEDVRCNSWGLPTSALRLRYAQSASRTALTVPTRTCQPALHGDGRKTCLSSSTA